MEAGFIQTKQFQFAYKKTGAGDEAWLLLHGFGQQSEIFLPAFKFLEKNCSIISIDLPYHGKTLEKQTHSEENLWEELFDKIASQLEIKRFNFFAHSIGARAILNYLPLAKIPVNKIIFVAADGFYDDFYFSFATKNVLGKRMFKWLKSHSNNLTKYVKTLAAFRIISKQKKHLAMLALENKIQIQQVYQVWNLFASFEIDLNGILQKMNKEHIDCLIIQGARDSIIDSRPAKKFASKSERVDVVVVGHTHSFSTAKAIATLSDTISLWLQKLDGR